MEQDIESAFERVDVEALIQALKDQAIDGPGRTKNSLSRYDKRCVPKV